MPPVWAEMWGVEPFYSKYSWNSMAKSADNEDQRPGVIAAKERAALKGRLSHLEDRLKKTRSLSVGPEGHEDAPARGRAIGYAFRLAIELVAGLVVGGGIGWYLDAFFGTLPLFLLIFFVLGLAAGILNVIRTAKEMQPTENRQDQPEQKGSGQDK